MFKRKVVLTEDEKLTLDVITGMLAKKECVIESTELSDYLLSLESLQYFLSVDSFGVKISNHDFIIVKNYRSDALDTFKKAILEETTHRVDLKRKSIFKNELDLLVKLCQKINN